MFKLKKVNLLVLVVLLASLIFSLNVFAAPTITSISPDIAMNWGQVDITEIIGAGFERGAQVVLSKSAQTDVEIMSRVLSATQISGFFNASNLEAGIWDVTVTNPDGTSETLSGGLTLEAIPAPTVTSNTPELSDYMGVVRVTVTGANFLTMAQVKIVRDGMPDIDATFAMTESDTSILCEFNLNEVVLGLWYIQVTNPDGQFGEGL